MKTYGIIMAGGGGTRFWPLSRQKTPKQLLNLSGRDVMINDTIKRMKATVNLEDVFIVTNINQIENMKKVLIKGFDESHILAEPSARNTAACIGYAATEILHKYGDGVMCIFPSDSYILDEDEFNRVLKAAVNTAETTNSLITIGIKPTFASTGYGYIRHDGSDLVAKKVVQFVEKPDKQTAENYVESGEYLWNSGMFVWKASVIMEMFKKLLPDIYEDLQKIGDAMNTEREFEVINEIYPTIRKISVDYGIMEHADNVLVLEGDFGWSDVGSFDSLDAIHSEDENGNIYIGEHVSIDTTNTISYSTGRLVTTIGIDNTIIVETDDAILVCDRNRAQDIKMIVEKLETDKYR